MPRPVSPRSFLNLFAVASLAAVALGVVICLQSGVPASLALRNLAAWAFGAVCAWALARHTGPRAMMAALVAAPVLLAASFIHPGLQGVHRWVGVGPLMFNAALLALPAFVVALAASPPARRGPWLMTLLSMTLLVAQPDASQAAALAASAAVVASGLAWPRHRRLLIGLGLLMAAAAALFRSDPVAPVAEVEEVLSLAWAVSPALALVAFAALLSAAAAPLLARGAPGAAALATYLVLISLAPFAGAFPTPLVGVGLSPVLGFWLGAGLLAAQLRRPAD